MERAFGTDFSAVRIHQDARAEALGARAFTRGTDIHFAPGAYQPESPSGQELLGHELAHVVQQSQGRVPATLQAKGDAVNADASLEREADDQGARAARGEQVSTGQAAPRAGSSQVVQGRFVVNPTAAAPELLAILVASPNAKLYRDIDGSNEFTVHVNLNAGTCDDPKVLGETSGSVDGRDEHNEDHSYDLKPKPGRLGNLDTYIQNIGGGDSAEIKVDIFDSYFRTDLWHGQRTEHTLSKWEKLASLIHELDLHVVPSYQRWLLARDHFRFGQGDQPTMKMFQDTGVDPRKGAEGIRAWIRAQIHGLVTQDEHTNRVNLINMVTTTYRYTSTMEDQMEALAILRSMQNDLDTMPGVSRNDAREIQEIGKQRSSG